MVPRIILCFLRIDTFVPLVFTHILRIRPLQLSIGPLTKISLIKLSITLISNRLLMFMKGYGSVSTACIVPHSSTGNLAISLHKGQALGQHHFSLFMAPAAQLLQ